MCHKIYFFAQELLGSTAQPSAAAGVKSTPATAPAFSAAQKLQLKSQVWKRKCFVLYLIVDESESYLKITDACLSPSCPWRESFGSGQESSHIKVSFLELLKDLYFILFLGFNLSTFVPCRYKQSFSITEAWKHLVCQRKRWRAWALLSAKSTLDVEINNRSCFFLKTLKYIYFLYLSSLHH